MTQLAFADRVQETALNVGANPLTLLGAADPKLRTFAAAGLDGATVAYVIEHRVFAEWEVGYGVYAAATHTLTRVAILANSAGTTSPIAFTNGAVDVWNDLPAPKVVALDADTNHLTLPDGITATGTIAAPTFAGNLAWSFITGTPTTLAGYGITDVYTKPASDARFAPIAGPFPWAGVTGTPTTVAGYGITDTYTKTESDARFAVAGGAVAWSTITGTPTTLGGYGITDAYTKTASDARFAPIGGPFAWSLVSGTPTTLAGYGITDAFTKTESDARYIHTVGGTIAWTSITGTPTTVAGYGITDTFTKTQSDARFAFVAGPFVWSGVTGRPTTLAGYGITDALTSAGPFAWSGVTGTPTTLGGYGIADAFTKTESDARFIQAVGEAIPWTAITGTPTTLAGYGITNAFTKTESDARYLQSVGAIPWTSITGTPTTIAGYGITDAYTKTASDARFAFVAGPFVWSGVTGRPTTLAGYGITDALTSAGPFAWSGVTGTPTTIAGYGITDAYTKTASDARFVQTVTGTAGRIAITGTATAPVVTIDAAYLGQASITTLGTITTGTWNGTLIAAAYGGTGFGTYAAGDLLYASAANTLSKLAVGTANQFLVVASGVPAWHTLVAADITDFASAATGITKLGTVTTGTWNATPVGPTFGGTGLTTYAAGDLLYASAANTLSKLAVGSASQVLTVVGGVPTWQTAAGGSVSAASVTSGTFPGTYTFANSLTVGIADGSSRYMTVNSTGGSSGFVVQMNAVNQWVFGRGIVGASNDFVLSNSVLGGPPALSFSIANNDATFSGKVIVGTDPTPGGSSILRVGGEVDTRRLHVYGTAGNSDAHIQLLGAVGGQYNWDIAINQTISNALQFLPSTATGGTSFPTPVVTITQTGTVIIGTDPGTTETLRVAGPIRGRTDFSSYTPDGLFGATAKPSVFVTPGGSGQLFMIGYLDGGSGQYCPRIGFQQITGGGGLVGAKTSIGLEIDGSMTFTYGAADTRVMRLTSAGAVTITGEIIGQYHTATGARNITLGDKPNALRLANQDANTVGILTETNGWGTLKADVFNAVSYLLINGRYAVSGTTSQTFLYSPDAAADILIGGSDPNTYIDNTTTTIRNRAGAAYATFSSTGLNVTGTLTAGAILLNGATSTNAYSLHSTTPAITVANNGLYAFSNVFTHGLFLIVNLTGGHVALVICAGTLMTIVSQSPGNAFSASTGTASSTNIYNSGTAWSIENKRGASQDYRILTISIK